MQAYTITRHPNTPQGGPFSYCNSSRYYPTHKKRSLKIKLKVNIILWYTTYYYLKGCIVGKKSNNPAMKKGMVSLNPAGRPKGSVNKYTALARELMSNKSPEIVEKVISKAMEGDVHCLKMCLDRILPVHKAVDPNRMKSDAQVIINVSSIESIQKHLGNTPDEKLVNPKEKNDDEVVVSVAANG